jgi:hypothetical protein
VMCSGLGLAKVGQMREAVGGASRTLIMSILDHGAGMMAEDCGSLK